MSSMEASNATIENFKRMFEQGKRFDGRGLFDLRQITAETKVSNSAEGSARIRLGKTEVLAGVKLAPGTPYPDSLDKGNLIVSGDLLPLASPRFESGPPGFEAIELPRLLDRAIRESHVIDLSKLVIKPNEKVWTVYIDVYPINDDGNLLDAALMACLAALRKSFLPELDKDGRIDYDKKMTKKLPLEEDTLPLSLSFFKLGDSLILDPTREEEEACDTRITFGISEWKGQHMLNSCQKKGESPLTKEDIGKVMDIIPEKFDELSKKLKNYI